MCWLDVMYASWSTAEDYGARGLILVNSKTHFNEVAVITQNNEFYCYVILCYYFYQRELQFSTTDVSDAYATINTRQSTFILEARFMAPTVNNTRIWTSGTWHRVVWYTATISEETAALMLDMVGSFELMVPTYQTTQCNITEHCNINTFSPAPFKL